MSYIAIHQPNFIPWIGYFHKISLSDTFVFLDDVQYSKGDFHNRNSIDSKNGKIYLTVPIRSNNSYERINKKQICYMRDWKSRHLKTLFYNYNQAPNFPEVYQLICSVYNQDHEFLYELNIDLIKKLLIYLKIDTQLISSSELNIDSNRTDKLVDICKILEGKYYIFGSGSSYLETAKFTENKLNLIPQNFVEPIYQRVNHLGSKNLSILDYVFNTDKYLIKESFLEDRMRIREKQLEFIT
ncbi:WbqC family protein [Planococcus halotolerans]|uniref:WbqC family protein n=1 Tax=Planococcus halotolerans TaxID=2233542 RepID=A0A365KK20_9BACL|nr:WbqC family protein [Planococcus halotolerans]RAZ73465.1 hypothetical protein DP120_17180 [Planococcus halotolerans]